MTSSNDKDSSLPHAASCLVLYTNLKGQKATNKGREKELRRKEAERNREEVDSEKVGVRVVFLGLNWLTHLGHCDVLP